MSINNSINLNVRNNKNDFNMSRSSYSFNPNKSKASSENKKLTEQNYEEKTNFIFKI